MEFLRLLLKFTVFASLLIEISDLSGLLAQTQKPPRSNGTDQILNFDDLDYRTRDRLAAEAEMKTLEKIRVWVLENQQRITRERDSAMHVVRSLSLAGSIIFLVSLFGSYQFLKPAAEIPFDARPLQQEIEDLRNRVKELEKETPKQRVEPSHAQSMSSPCKELMSQIALPTSATSMLLLEPTNHLEITQEFK